MIRILWLLFFVACVPTRGNKALLKTGEKQSPSVSSLEAFKTSVYPVVRNNCVACHADLITPFFAHDDYKLAHDAIINTNKVNFDNITNSRLVKRLAEDNHNCWSDSCINDAGEMEQAIARWKQLSEGDNNENSSGQADWIYTATLKYSDGQSIEQQVDRYRENIVAEYEFDENMGNTINDKSGVTPAMNLTIVSGNTTWLSPNGLQINNSSNIRNNNPTKLVNQIKPAGGFSIETWVRAENTAQSGPARIVSYSNGTTNRNFTLAQNATYYDFRLRTNATDANGTPSLRTADNTLEANMQHVVSTFDGTTRKIYINGVERASNTNAAGNITGWNDSYDFIIANETSGNRPWRGTFQYLALYKEALAADKVQQNFAAGGGANSTAKKLVYDVSSIAGMPGVSFEIEMQDFDAYSYLFTNPRIVTATQTVPVKNIQIFVNGTYNAQYATFNWIDTTVIPPGETLSSAAMIVGKMSGIDADQFTFGFKVLGNGSPGGSLGTPDPTPTPTSTPTPPPGGGDPCTDSLPLFISNVRPILNSTCLGCHGPSNPYNVTGTDLQVCLRSTNYINSVSPGNSALIQKPAFANPFHGGGAGLIDAGEIDQIQQWINAEIAP